MTSEEFIKILFAFGPPALVSAPVSALTSLFVYWWTSKSAERRWIADGITKLIDVSMAYPNLDNAKQTCQWPNPLGWSDEDNIRYENYCSLAFNLVSRVHKACGGDKDKMESLFHFREIVDKHKTWWNFNLAANKEAYGPLLAKWMVTEIAFSNEKQIRRATQRIQLAMTEHGDQLDDTLMHAIEASIEKVKAAVKGYDVGAINSAIAALQQAQNLPAGEAVLAAISSATEVLLQVNHALAPQAG